MTVPPNAAPATALRRKRIIAGSFICVVALGTAVGLWRERKLTQPNREHVMSESTKNMKTVCIGRYLIDIPSDAEFSLGDAESDSVKIERIPSFASESAYREKLKEHEQLLRSAKHETEGTRLRSVIQASGGRNTVFISREDDQSTRISKVESFLFVAPSAWLLRQETSDEFVTKLIDEMMSVASLLTPRDMTVVPTSSGACIRDGLLARLPAYRETFNGGAQLKAQSWSLSITSETSGPREPGKQLFDRVDRAIEMAGSNSGIKKLRRAKVSADGRSGQEYIAIYPDERALILDAKLELYGTGKPQVPTVKLQMEVGSLRKPDPRDPRKFMSDEDAMALWDAIIKSIRPRPGAF